MNIPNKTPVAIAVAAAFSATAASAAAIPVELIAVTQGSTGGTSQAYLTGSTATWSFDTATGIITGDGLLQARYTVSGQDILTEQINDLAVGGGIVAAATSYSCVEGNFGGLVGASICGNYNFGDDNSNESTTTWGPGTAFARTIGGDDVAQGIQENLSQYDGMTTSYNGGTLIRLIKFFPDSPTNSSLSMEFTAVIPVPAAVWLFGSALAVLGWARRRNNK